MDKNKSFEPSFSSLVISMATMSIVKMGLDPNSKEEKNLDMARYNIDLLEILQQKTKNNLSEEEQKLLDQCVKDLKLQYVQVEQNTDSNSTKKES